MIKKLTAALLATLFLTSVFGSLVGCNSSKKSDTKSDSSTMSLMTVWYSSIRDEIRSGRDGPAQVRGVRFRVATP